MNDPLGANIAEKGVGVQRPGEQDRERARRSTAPGSLGFAAAVALPCLVVSLGLGLGLIYVPPLFEPEPTPYASPGTTTSEAWPTTTPHTTTRYTTTSTAPSGVPAGYYEYTGPAGLVTVLPNSFAVSSTGNPGSVVAKNQLDTDIEVRFGGAAPEPYGLLETITRAADATASRRSDYLTVTLEETTHDGRAAVDWEFRYRTSGGEARQSRSRHWRVKDVEYVLVAEAPQSRWAEAARLLDTMIDHSDTP